MNIGTDVHLEPILSMLRALWDCTWASVRNSRVATWCGEDRIANQNMDIWTCMDMSRLGTRTHVPVELFFFRVRTAKNINWDGETSVKLGIVDGAILGDPNR